MTPPEPTSATGEPSERLDHVRALLDSGDVDAVVRYLTEVHPSDVADIVEELGEEVRVLVVGRLPAELASETLAEMDSEERPEEILASFHPERIGELVAELADDDAVDLIRDLAPEQQARVLAALPGMEAGVLRRLLQYPEESAGGIMTTELVAVRVELTAVEAIDEVRRQANQIGGDFYTVFVVDARRRLRGTVAIQDLVLSAPDTRLDAILVPPVATVPVDMDQEDVGRIIARYNVPSIAVLGPDDLLVGRVTWDDVMDVIEAEQTEDILRLAGVTADEEVRGGWAEAVRSRLPWLVLNLCTAAISGSVVYMFRETIDAVLVLAAIMPVVAGLGGNAGTQTLAVTVRRLALGDESAERRWGVAGKEMLVGLFNGAVLGGLVGTVSYIWQGSAALGFVVLFAMWGNQVIATFAGAFVPIMLESLGVDPAVASSVFVTALTDLTGFFLLLGLAAALIL